MFFIFLIIIIVSGHFARAIKSPPDADSIYLKKIDELFEKQEITAKEIELLYKEIHYHELVKFYENKKQNALFWPIPAKWLPDSILLDLSYNFSDYCNPIQGVITSGFGWRDGRMHKGIDIDLRKGDPVKAVADGTVRFAGKCGGWGNVVVIDHGHGIETLYAHLSKILVKQGQQVLSEQILGKGGNTGRSRGPHLHFELRYLGHPVNPLSLIKFEEAELYENKVLCMKNNRDELFIFPAHARIHLSEKGENWRKIAKSCGKNIKELYHLNGIIRPLYLKPNTFVRVE
ncbi:MAG: M23 family metallopeptidase [Bacteroidia bacterium]|nr:M23 family metallopeptidase [Bacteroidia bacterium]